MKTTAAAALLLALGGFTNPCTARVPSAQECREGGDFIYDAAPPRDNGEAHRRAFLAECMTHTASAH